MSRPDRLSPTPSEDARVVTVRTASGSYPVHVEAGLRERLDAWLTRVAPASRYVLIADDTVFALFGEAVVRRVAKVGGEPLALTFPAGEASKTTDTWRALSERMAVAGCDRDCVVVGLGGGVTTDLAGFVASTFMRGVPVVQVPTTLLAMSDASVGGKTGVNLPAGKNLLGAFHAPAAVLIDPECTRTLAPHLRAEGLVEAVKHGAIADRDHLDQVTGLAGRLRDGDAEATEAIVRRTVAIKADIVGRDEREHGPRALLNFGHTVGHALERATGWDLPHGRAVALGMLVEARAAELDGLTREGTRAVVRGSLEALQVDLDPPPLPPETVLAATTSDKKVRRGQVRYVVLEEAGVPRKDDWLRPLSESGLRRAWTELRS